METILTASPEETFKVGIDFARRLKPGDAVALAGELGTGKTILAKGICRGLGFTGEVTSPSFVRLHRYSVGQTFLSDKNPPAVRRPRPTAGVDAIYHADFYLVQSEGEALGIGLDELYYGDCVVLVEWAQRFPQMLPDGCWWIEIEWRTEGENERIIRIKKSIVKSPKC